MYRIVIGIGGSQTGLFKEIGTSQELLQKELTKSFFHNNKDLALTNDYLENP